MGAHSAPRKKSSRFLTLALIAVVAAAAWWVVFGRDGGDTRQDGSSARRQSSQDASGATSTTRVHKRSATGTVETFEVFASRDPFAPLVADGSKDTGSEEPTGNEISLIDAADDGVAGAQIEVNGTVHTIAEGETFAENFKLLSVSGECASLLYGDDQFTICEGEQILK